MTLIHNTRKTSKQLLKWMRYTQEQTAEQFAKLPGAIRIKLKTCDIPAVYVPGKLNDRVLLVAHTDTVCTRDGKQAAPYLDGLCIRSRNNNAIGADDRAGCNALWELRKSGHSLLVVPEEESGCIGSGELAYACEQYPEWEVSKCLRRHQFAIQFDRRGSHDLVTYGCDNPEFDDYLENMLPGYHTTDGSFSDICELCPVLGMAGVNISIGFRKEHTKDETLDVLDYLRTVELVRRLLSYECPRFEYIEATPKYAYLGYQGYHRSTGPRYRFKSKPGADSYPQVAKELKQEAEAKEKAEKNTQRNAEKYRKQYSTGKKATNLLSVSDPLGGGIKYKGDKGSSARRPMRDPTHYSCNLSYSDKVLTSVQRGAAQSPVPFGLVPEWWVFKVDGYYYLKSCEIRCNRTGTEDHVYWSVPNTVPLGRLRSGGYKQLPQYLQKLVIKYNGHQFEDETPILLDHDYQDRVPDGDCSLLELTGDGPLPLVPVESFDELCQTKRWCPMCNDYFDRDASETQYCPFHTHVELQNVDA
jgi:hypothetical protein